MTKQKVVTARISSELYDAIAAIAAKNRLSLSAVASRLLADGLSQVDKLPDWASDIEQRVSQLEKMTEQPVANGSRKKKRGR